MATKGGKKVNIDANEIFLQYEEDIVTNPIYAGMPDLRHEDGSIQWEAPSNRTSGEFKDSHGKRLNWWRGKSAEIGINTNENKWISKVAKKIHPTGLHPCKVCGKVMDIRYCYLSANFIKRVEKLSFYNDSIEMNEITHILNFIATFVNTFGGQAYGAIPYLLKCKQCPSIPNFHNNLEKWSEWIDKTYIPLEPSMLGPGTMSNAPDRLDGFHTFNRCCRSKSDKGRSKENLASYSTDRRAFENWVDGNWITANKLMGYINSNPEIKKLHCVNYSEGQAHPLPCSADHIGPISLGFCHRPEFQLLCAPCNSAKNNRMYYSDIQHLISVENSGETVTTWYATPTWQACKYRVTDSETALRLSRIMRDNRNVAMFLLYEFMEKKEYLFLYSFLNLDYADYEYAISTDGVSINNHIVTSTFTQNPSTLKYVNTQKVRKIRVAYSALEEYALKDNRNGYMYNNFKIESLKQEAFRLLTSMDKTYKEYNQSLYNILSDLNVSDSYIETFINNFNITAVTRNPIIIQVKEILYRIMNSVAEELASNWDNARYSRE